MAETNEVYFYQPAVTEFQVLLEEVTRAKPGSPDSRFVEPDAETYDRLRARFHHALYGRRGTGKSSLLRKMQSQAIADKRLIAWTDQETFSALSYPDVLVATLAEVFRQFAVQLRLSAAPQNKPWFRKPSISEEEALSRLLDDAVIQLIDLKNSPTESEVEWTASYVTHATTLTETGLTLEGASEGVKVGGKRGRSKTSSSSAGSNVARRYRASKTEHLERAVTTYRDLMKMVAGQRPDGFIILDDFYRLPEQVQPSIAGYFHRVVKDTSVWLKFGSIPFWTRLYKGGSPAVGLQVPHDLRELSLDRGLPDFNNSKRFLENILGSLAAEKRVDIHALFSDGALDRLVLAAGGVPRDYIGLASDSISVAKNRGVSAKSGSQRVIAEDVNEAAGRTVALKFADLDEDAREKSDELRELIIKITAHCRVTGCAWFLADTLDQALVKQLGRLQNMRFVHLIDSNESLPDPQSSRYLVYILDVSQLAAQRAAQVDFMGWTKRERRRARKLVFSESTITPEVVERAGSIESVQVALYEDADAIVSSVDAPVSTDMSEFSRDT